MQTSAPSDVFATQDGHVLIHTVGDGLFKRWAAMIGQPELAQDPDYQGDQNRGDKRDELCAMMQQWCADKPTDEVLSALDAAGVPSWACHEFAIRTGKSTGCGYVFFQICARAEYG